MFTQPALLGRLVLAGSLFIALSAGAAAAEWRVTALRGAALVLAGEKWHELRSEAVLTDPVVLRTMGSGRVSLAGEGVSLSLGGGSVVEVQAGGKGATLHQFAGTVAAATATGYGVDIDTPFGLVSLGTGQIRVVLLKSRARIELIGGTATMTGLSGTPVELDAGEVGELVEGGPVDTTAPGRSETAGKPESPGKSDSSNAGGNGNSDNAGSNAGANGNSGGSPGSNAGGNGKGNSGNQQ